MLRPHPVLSRKGYYTPIHWWLVTMVTIWLLAAKFSPGPANSARRDWLLRSYHVTQGKDVVERVIGAVAG